MNFKRIELIFLGTFIALNLFLLGMFIQNQNLQTEKGAQGNSNSTILKEISNDQIKVGHLSNKGGFSYYASGSQDDLLKTQANQLENQTVRMSKKKLKSEFKTPIELEDNDPVKTINNKLSDPEFVSFGNEYKYNSELSTDNELIYTQTAFGYPIYSSSGQIRFDLNSKRNIVSYTQGHLDNIASLRERSETISQQQAVILLYQYNQIPNNTKISWVKLGYTKYITVDNNQVLIPTWQVAIRSQVGGNNNYVVKRINAFSGSLIKENENNTSLK